jgi:gluconate 2-dehydrogenase gamma chain
VFIAASMMSGCSASSLANSATDAAAAPPVQVTPGGWVFFTPEEAALVEVLVDRLIPPDPTTPGGKDAGVAVFIDRQLAGPYGTASALYMRPPFADGLPGQGPQSPLTPAARYRQALAALDQHSRDTFAGKVFREIPQDQQIAFITRMESGNLVLNGSNGRAFFEMLLANTKEGFFADPIYGGNRGMVAWKMIGFPGARYDYRDWVGRHNERYPKPPVGLSGSAT